MSDAQRERTQKGQAAREAGSVDGAYTPSAAGASVGSEPARSGAGLDGGHESRPGESEPVSPTFGLPDERPIIIVRVVGRSDVGLVREHNEDNYLLADLGTGSRDPQTFAEVPLAGLVLAVCDGMGGAAAGEVASQMAVDTLYEMMRGSAPSADRDALARSLVRSIEEAGARIFDAARADRSRRGMGTTATVAALMDRTLFVGQVGDSRAYVLRGGELRQVTKDQSLVNQLIEAGQLTEDEAEAFEHSNIILQALGTTEQVSVDLTFLELRRGDRLLLCSDGLSGLVHGDVIRDVLKEQQDLSACCERLIELAKAGGGHDNVTVIVAEFAGEALALPHGDDVFGYQQYPLPLDPERPAATAPQHDAPTLSPPSSPGVPPPDDLELPRGARSGQGASSAGRIFLFAMLIVGAAFALYYWMSARDRRALRSDSRALAPVPAAEVAAARVEVLVRTDVEGGELLVDGESYGTAEGGRWLLALSPGPHRLEARAGGSSITSSLVTVREGVPATVVLSMPEGASLALGDAGSGTAEAHKGRIRRERAGVGLLADDASDRRARKQRDRAAAIGSAEAGRVGPVSVIAGRDAAATRPVGSSSGGSSAGGVSKETGLPTGSLEATSALPEAGAARAAGSLPREGGVATRVLDGPREAGVKAPSSALRGGTGVTRDAAILAK